MKLLSRILLAGSLSLATAGHGWAQVPALEQTVQTNVLRDIARELRTLNETLRRMECLERSRYASSRYCDEERSPERR